MSEAVGVEEEAKSEEEVEVEAPCDVKEESTGFSDEDD